MVAACSVAAIVAIYYVRREPRVDTKAATAAPAVSKPALDARDQGRPRRSGASESKRRGGRAGRIAPTAGQRDGVPAFDVARIEPTGEAVIAGRAMPGATVELLRNGEHA